MTAPSCFLLSPVPRPPSDYDVPEERIQVFSVVSPGFDKGNCLINIEQINLSQDSFGYKFRQKEIFWGQVS